MVKFHHTLSGHSIYNRYLEFLGLEERIAHERLARLCFIDYDREMALVVEHLDPLTGEKAILGVGRLSKSSSANAADFALIISDLWQTRGLGTRLLQLLVLIAKDEHLEYLSGAILADNLPMKEVCRRAGFHLEALNGSGTITASLRL
jgi:acetyltransferase